MSDSDSIPLSRPVLRDRLLGWWDYMPMITKKIHWLNMQHPPLAARHIDFPAIGLYDHRNT